MKTYAYKAVHKSGQVHKGVMSAANENELAFLLHQINLELITAKPRERIVKDFSFIRQSRKGFYPEIIALCNHLHDMLGSGVPFEEAFILLSEETSYSPLTDALKEIVQDIRSGKPVSLAFAAHPDLFDPVFQAILASGEKSGNLAETFGRLAEHLQWQHQITKQMKRALRYPLFLLLLTFCVIGFMTTMVMPELLSFLESLQIDLPLTTQLLIFVARIFGILWWLVPLLLAVATIFFFSLRSFSQSVRLGEDHFLIGLPVLGTLWKQLALARLTSSMAILVRSGLTLNEALQTAEKTLNNEALRRMAQQAHNQMIAGASFSSVCRSLFPPFILQILKIAEKSGTMPKALDQIALSIKKEAQESVDLFLGTLEPTLTLLVGGLMAWIVLAVLGPVYNALAPLSSQGM